MSTHNECGTCTLCCEILPIPEIPKPENVLCSNCTKNQGCNIYSSRPKSCIDFRCLFIETDMVEELRPNKCNIIFEKITETVYIGTRHKDNLNDWNSVPVINYMKSLNEKGISIILTSFTNSPKLFILANGKTKEQILAEAMVEYNKFKNK